MLILSYSLAMQDVIQKRLAIVVMIVITALKISWAVGFLLKNDIFKFLFKILIIIFFLPHPSSPARRGSTSPPKSSLLRSEDLKPGRPSLYSQTSSRPFGVARDYLRNRVAIVYAPMARLPQGVYRPQIITDWHRLRAKGSDWVD